MSTLTAPTYQRGTRLADLRRAMSGIVVRVTDAAPGCPERLDVIWSDATMWRQISQAVSASLSILPGLADTEQINAAFAAVVDAEAERMRAKQAETATVEQARARMLAEHPELQQAGSSRFSGPALAAANLRAQLKAAFPGVKFRVHSSRYSGGDSINVRWIDGPLASQVEDLADRYQEGRFDGSDDSYHYARGAAAVWCDLFGGAKHVFCDRGFSDTAIGRALTEVLSQWGAPEGAAPTVDDWKQGRLYRTPPARHCDDLQTLVRQALHARAWDVQ